jgi:hypothetical protein
MCGHMIRLPLCICSELPGNLADSPMGCPVCGGTDLPGNAYDSWEGWPAQEYRPPRECTIEIPSQATSASPGITKCGNFSKRFRKVVVYAHAASAYIKGDEHEWY